MFFNGTRAVNLKEEHYPSLFLIIYRERIQKNNRPIFCRSTTCMHQKFKNKSLGRSISPVSTGLARPRIFRPFYGPAHLHKTIKLVFSAFAKKQ